MSLAALAAVMAFSVPAGAAGKGECFQWVRDVIETWSSEGTTGDAISDGLYGNEPNVLGQDPDGPSEVEPGSGAGSVVPSQSPGPKVTLPDGSVVQGATMGNVMKAVTSAVC